MGSKGEGLASRGRGGPVRSLQDARADAEEASSELFRLDAFRRHFAAIPLPLGSIAQHEAGLLAEAIQLWTRRLEEAEEALQALRKERSG